MHVLEVHYHRLPVFFINSSQAVRLLETAVEDKYATHYGLVQGAQPAGRMRPPHVFCAARPYFFNIVFLCMILCQMIPVHPSHTVSLRSILYYHLLLGLPNGLLHSDIL
jgi:hypothetical protein